MFMYKAFIISTRARLKFEIHLDSQAISTMISDHAVYINYLPTAGSM